MVDLHVLPRVPVAPRLCGRLELLAGARDAGVATVVVKRPVAAFMLAYGHTGILRRNLPPAGARTTAPFEPNAV